MRILVVVARLVPGRGDDEHPGRVGGGDGVADSLRVLRVAPRVVRDHGAVGSRVEERFDRVGGRARPVVPHHPQGHDPCARGDARDAEPVAGDRGNRARDVRPVAVPVLRGRVLLDEVPAADVVDVAVAVVVEPVAGDLIRIAPGVRGEIGVRERDAGVDHRHGHARAGGDVPGLGRVDVRVGDARQPGDGLTRVVEPPELAEARVVRERVEAQTPIRLDIPHVRVQLQRPAGGGPADTDDARADAAEALRGGAAGAAHRLVLSRRRHAAAEADDELDLVVSAGTPGRRRAEREQQQQQRRDGGAPGGANETASFHVVPFDGSGFLSP